MSGERRFAASALAALALLTACAHSPAAGPKASAPLPSPTPPPAPVAPAVGSCHRLDFSAAAALTDATVPVSCGRRHTSQTFYVGTFDPIVDGHLLAVDATAVQRQISHACPPRVGRFLGGTTDALRTSAVQVVWFSPSVAQDRRGAHWFRCDVVALAGHDVLSSLPTRMHGALGRSSLRDRLGTCANVAPGHHGFQRTICARPHTWRAVTAIDIRRGSSFLGAHASAAASASCKSVAAARAGGALSYRWSFEWPTRSEWNAGRRYGLCWVPSR